MRSGCAQPWLLRSFYRVASFWFWLLPVAMTPAFLIPLLDGADGPGGLLATFAIFATTGLLWSTAARRIVRVALGDIVRAVRS